MNNTNYYLYVPSSPSNVSLIGDTDVKALASQIVYTGLDDNGLPAIPYVVLEIGKSTWSAYDSQHAIYTDTWDNVMAQITPENITEVRVTRRATSNGAYELGAVASSQVNITLRYDESEETLLPFSLNGLKVRVFYGYKSENHNNWCFLICMGKYIIDGTTVNRGNGLLSFTAFDLLSIDLLDKEMIVEEVQVTGTLSYVEQRVKAQEQYGDSYLSPTSTYQYLPYAVELNDKFLGTPFDRATLFRQYLGSAETDNQDNPLGFGVKEFLSGYEWATPYLSDIYGYALVSGGYSDYLQCGMNAFLQPSCTLRDLLTAIAACSGGFAMSSSEGNLMFNMARFGSDISSYSYFTPDDYYSFQLTSAYEEDINSAYAEIEDTTNNQYLRKWYEIENNGVPIAYGGDYVGYDTQVDVRSEQALAVLGKRIFSEGWSEAVDGETHDPHPIQYNAFTLELNRQIWLEPLDRIAVTDNENREYDLIPFIVEYRFGGGFKTVLSAERCGNVLESIYIDDALSATSENLLSSSTIAAFPSLPSWERPSTYTNAEAQTHLENMLGVVLS